jgi:myo-inositol 2-dehydrogenase/D-chiro-inositol 1-dehydrogenase
MNSLERLHVAVVGLGRMGVVHALHLHELAQAGAGCSLAALVDIDPVRACRFGAEVGGNVPVFSSVAEFASSGICEATVIVTPTGTHRETAEALIAAGQRVLLEKPLTGTLDGDREFAAALDRSHPDSLMLAFQRRFDAPLCYARELIGRGAVGRVFKVYSSLEDSNPAPNGYKSGGILPDMSIHNVDEILWLTGRVPRKALAIGTRIYSHRLTTCEEDFDDALLYLWFDEEMAAQIQVSRNHVSGYRVETLIFGEEGQIQIGRFDQKPFEITVDAYGRRGGTEPLEHRVFSMRDYGRLLPEFVDRFGPAYKAELAAFVDCCRNETPFPTSHRDGLRAQEIISAAMQNVITGERAMAVETA